VLLHCARELKGQLAAERLLSRGHKLEVEVARCIVLKGQMRARIDELTTLLLSAAAANTLPLLAEDRLPAGRQQQPHHHHHREGGGGGGGGGWMDSGPWSPRA
jgi:hypothetical protein